MKSLFLFVSTLACLGLTGCVVPIPQLKPVLETRNYSKGSHPPSLRAWQGSQPLKFLLVHGMGNHPFGPHSERDFGDGTYAGLQKRLLNWDAQDVEWRQKVTDAALKAQYSDFIEYYTKKSALRESEQASFELILDDERKLVLGYVFRRVFTPENGAQGQPVEFYGACWSMISSYVKEKTYGARSGKAPEGEIGDFTPFIDRHRHSINRAAKEGVVNWGLTDAALYVGALHGKLEWAVATAMDRLASKLGPQDRVAIVTYSLGSAITYNALLQLLNGEAIDGQSFNWSPAAKSRLTSLVRPTPAEKQRCDDESRVAFYMFANQYGLLTSANEVAAKVTGRRLNQNNEMAMAQASPVVQLEKVVGHRPVQLVAFTDPDDLLSFPLPSKSGSPVKVRNVYLNNNRYSAFQLLVGPIPLGQLTNPLKAHTGHGTNPVVYRIMREGLADDKTCAR